LQLREGMRLRLLPFALILGATLACGGPDDDALEDASGAAIVRTPLSLRPTYFGATGATVRAASSWGTASTGAPQPQSTRSLTFWGRFVSAPCSSTAWGFNVAHALTTPLGTVDAAYYPECGGVYGPSVEADVLVSGTPNHLLRTVSRAAGPFTGFSAAGQNGSGANAYIQGAYVDFNPRWDSGYASRMKPWSASYTNLDRLRVAIRGYQSVTQASIPQPTVQQLQQVMRVVFINERCDRAMSRSYCQIEFNVKTHVSGVNAYSPGSNATAFNDQGQGGLIAVVGPINTTGRSTDLVNAQGRRSAWTSWATATRATTFGRSLFQIEISWSQFQAVLNAVTANNPAPVFGSAWNDRNAWVLLRAGYGQENYNRGNTTSTIEGLVENLEVISVGW
jgi:hypothetical protein